MYPVFLTMHLVRTQAADETEIRNYVNGSEVARCSQSGAVYGGVLNLATCSQFSFCVANCGHVTTFSIKNGTVKRHTPSGALLHQLRT